MTEPSPAPLRMRFTRFEDLVAPELPKGYHLRAFRPGDEDAWLGLLTAGDGGACHRAWLDSLMAGGAVEVPLEGILFATHGDELVGTACVLLHRRAETNGYIPELALVAVHPR